jgi:hypothetical protein
MGMFGFIKKREDIVDLGERYKKQQSRVQQNKPVQTSQDNGMGFLSGLANAGNQKQIAEEDYPVIGENVEQKKQKLAKRLMDITNKMEDLSNQLFHLQQRLEVIERKMNVKFE